jgi:hypothetical protein
MLYRVRLAWAGYEFKTLVVIGTNYINSSKSNHDHDHLIVLKTTIRIDN